MKKFLIQLFGLFFFVLTIYYTLISQADGFSDPYYLRFTSPKQESLIIGTSKAAQGIQPEVINRILGTNLYNYSFSVGASPFGEVYLNSLKQKLKVNSQQGIFIVTVDPWSISSKEKAIENEESFRENNNILGTTKWVNINPNIFYMIKSYNDPYKDLLEPSQSWYYLHEDGWLEVFAKSDSISLKESRKRVLEDWLKENNGNYYYSPLRFNYLKEIIQYLKQKGEVYLVRLPVDEQMLEAEDNLMPDFNSKMQELEPLTDGYFNMTVLNKEFVFHDGVHLHPNSGKEASKMIANWILIKREVNKE